MKRKYFFVMLFLLVFSITFVKSSFGFKRNVKEIIYNGSHLMVSIDGENGDKLPVSGNYYLANYECNNKNTVVSWDRENYQLSVSNGNKKGGVSCYLNFESNPKLADMDAGSYVLYTGNNGCSGNQCSGENANYINDSNMGYCRDSSNQFISKGFRIAYTKGKSAYLISAGALECGCTNSNGSKSSNCINEVNVQNFSSHLENLDSIALKYCNVNYVSDGICDYSNVRSINQEDFELILRRGLDIWVCLDSQNKKCGYVNDLIDIGSDYWYAVGYNVLSNKALYWDSTDRVIKNSVSSVSYGIRPVIKMDENVIVIGGSGTSHSPYQIANRTFLVKDIDKKNEVVTLRMIGYDAKKMCVNINSTVCTSYVDYQDTYLLDISDVSSGDSIIYVYYKDDKDNIIATMNRKIVLE